MKKDDIIYVEHIADCILKIERYLHEVSEEEFYANEEKQDAVIRKIEIIGEAAKHISVTLERSHPEIPWKIIKGMRDKLAHDYLDVDIDIVWKTATFDIPNLKLSITNLLNSLTQE